jgi:hypothetical protein
MSLTKIPNYLVFKESSNAIRHSNHSYVLNSFAFNYRSHETKIILFCVHAKWILAL